MTKEETCRMFGCTMEQLNAQYAANALQLADMRDRALSTGKKVNNLTAQHLSELASNFKALSA